MYDGFLPIKQLEELPSGDSRLLEYYIALGKASTPEQLEFFIKDYQDSYESPREIAEHSVKWLSQLANRLFNTCP